VVVIVAAGVGFFAVRSLIHEHSGSSSATASPVNSAATGGAPEPSPEGSCTTGPTDHNVRVTIYGPGEAACTRVNREEAEGSEQFWRIVPTGNEVQGSELVCSMAQGGGELIEVRDTGEYFYGNRMCARLTAKGWHEQEGPGEKAERARKSHEAETRAAAEQREVAERAEAERKRAAEQKKQEAQQKKQEAAEAATCAEEERKRDAEQHQEEAHQRKEQAETEQRNKEETHRSEEESHRAERETEAPAH
jgi:hypothetical protein